MKLRVVGKQIKKKVKNEKKIQPPNPKAEQHFLFKPQTVLRLAAGNPSRSRKDFMKNEIFKIS